MISKHPSQTNPENPDKKTSIALTDQEKRFLVEYSRRVLIDYTTQRQTPDIISHGRLDTMKRGAFVTLYKKNNLRGCIGYIEPIKTCLEAVRDNTISAAARDPRFSVVIPGELDDITIEISILTPPEAIDSWRDIEIGKHGIILEKGHNRSVFLPQVPVEQQWDLETTLNHLAMKAGLPFDAWKDNTGFKVFETEIIKEDDYV